MQAVSGQQAGKRVPTQAAQRLWLTWVGANTLGGAVGSLLIAGIILLPEYGYLAAFLSAGALIWAPLGLFQGLFVARRISRGRRWVAAWVLYSTAGGFASWYIIMGLGVVYGAFYASRLSTPPWIGTLLGLLLGGGVIGVSQAILLAGRLRRVGWWILANVEAWIAAVCLEAAIAAIVQVLAGSPVTSNSESTLLPAWLWIILGVCTAAIAAAMTGVFLIWLLQHPIEPVVVAPASTRLVLRVRNRHSASH